MAGLFLSTPGNYWQGGEGEGMLVGNPKISTTYNSHIFIVSLQMTGIVSATTVLLETCSCVRPLGLLDVQILEEEY